MGEEKQQKNPMYKKPCGASRMSALPTDVTTKSYLIPSCVSTCCSLHHVSSGALCRPSLCLLEAVCNLLELILAFGSAPRLHAAMQTSIIPKPWCDGVKHRLPGPQQANMCSLSQGGGRTAGVGEQESHASLTGCCRCITAARNSSSDTMVIYCEQNLSVSV